MKLFPIITLVGLTGFAVPAAAGPYCDLLRSTVEGEIRWTVVLCDDESGINNVGAIIRIGKVRNPGKEETLSYFEKPKMNNPKFKPWGDISNALLSGLCEPFKSATSRPGFAAPPAS